MIPYSLEEAKLVIKNHNMDIYHEELMKWLVSEIERLQSLILKIEMRENL